MKRCVAFAGGGSGGHLYPALAIAERLRARHPEIEVVFWSTGRDLDRRIVSPSGHRYEVTPSLPLPSLRKHPLQFGWQNLQGIRCARKLIRAQRPAVVIGCGGFASAPGVLAAALSRIPALLLEQNAWPGRATRFLSRFARTVCVSFADARDHFPERVNCRVTGNPVRAAIADLAIQDGNSSRAAHKTLLVLGGSQGARGLNEAVPTALTRIRRRLGGWRVIHQAGAEQVDRVRAAYQQAGVAATVAPFFDDMPELYRETSLVISRAGATTLAELACAGIPAVLVPYPHSADRHQHHNAVHFANAGAADCVEESEDPMVTAEALTEAIVNYIGDTSTWHAAAQAMRGLARPNAADEVLDEIRRWLDRSG